MLKRSCGRRRSHCPNRLERIGSTKAGTARGELAVEDAPPKLPPVEKNAIVPMSAGAKRGEEVVVEVATHGVAEKDTDGAVDDEEVRQME